MWFWEQGRGRHVAQDLSHATWFCWLQCGQALRRDSWVDNSYLVPLKMPDPFACSAPSPSSAERRKSKISSHRSAPKSASEKRRGKVCLKCCWRKGQDTPRKGGGFPKGQKCLDPIYSPRFLFLLFLIFSPFTVHLLQGENQKADVASKPCFKPSPFPISAFFSTTAPSVTPI